MAKKHEDNEMEMKNEDVQAQDEPVVDQPQPETDEQKRERMQREGQDMTNAAGENVAVQAKERKEQRDVVKDLYNRVSQFDLTQPLSAEQVEMVARYLAIKEVGY